MAMHLYEHNQIAYNAAVTMLAERGKAAVIHPTGTGKSFIGFKLCEDNPDKTICWLSPSRYIYQTQLENLADTSDGYQPNNVKFYTYAKLMNVTAEEIAEIKPDYIILDEFHRCGAELWGAGVDAVLKAYTDVPVLGLSATAIRYLDNQRDMTDELFDGNVASEMTLGEAIVRGILAPPKYILSVYSVQAEFEKYEQRVRNAKYKAMRDEATVYLETLRRALDKAEKIDETFDKHMDDRVGKYIVFCANREHMEDMIDKADEWFRKIDKKPHIYKAFSSDPETSKAFADFKADTSNHLKLLYCIDMLNEGVHVDDISGVILLRPTVSPIIYKQQIGRALSASKSHSPVIFDIVNNIENLYSIDAVAEEMQQAIRYYHANGRNSNVVNETFELIDKVADCKALFEELEGVLSASWDIMFEKAKAYYEQYGDLEVPKDYYTEDGYSLGMWIATQRGIYRGTALDGRKPLTQVQIDKLTAIGMRWQSLAEILWEGYYESAKCYFDKHGDLLARFEYVDENGVALGKWLGAQRRAKKYGTAKFVLTEERIAKLDALGMVWDVLDYLWEENYAAAVRYHKEHGNLIVPVNYIDSNGIKLGQWLCSLRVNRRSPDRGALTDEQIARLDALDMVWEDRNTIRWNKAFQALCDYYEQNHTLQVPQKYRTPDGFNLSAWTARQRYLYKRGKLEQSQIDRLQSIGFEFETVDKWEENFKIVKAYYEEHGDLNIPDGLIKGSEPQKWLVTQKSRAEGKTRDKLSPDKIEKLRSIGLLDEKVGLEKKWYQRYEMAKAYFAEHGDLRIPKTYLADGFQLGVWVNMQRRKKRSGELSKEKIALLNEIGMEWERYFQQSDRPLDSGEQWECLYNEVKKYFDEHDVTELPKGLVGESGFSLPRWLKLQCKAYKNGELTDEQKRKMDGIGYPKKPKLSPAQIKSREEWRKNYEIVREFLELHKGEKLDQNSEYKGVTIIAWLRRQHNAIKNGEITDDRVKLFETLDYENINWITHWDILYEAAAAFFAENGLDTMIPKDIIVDGVSLRNWVNTERKTISGKLDMERSPEQIEMLAKIGIVPLTQGKNETLWLEKYEELKLFVKKYSRLPVNKKALPEEKPLAMWLYRQKKDFAEGKLKSNRVKLLRDIGIELQ